VIPWGNGTRTVTTPELQDGESSLSELLHLLPKLKGIMLVGQRAARAKSRRAQARQGVACKHWRKSQGDRDGQP
jgi:hypothetical protein